MGLFVICAENDPIKLLEAALANIDLWKNDNYNSDYLVKDFSYNQIKRALKVLKEEEKP